MSKKMVVLKSSDDQLFEVDEVAARQSRMIGHFIEDNCANNVIPLANVTSNILLKVIEYCKKHADADSLSSDESEEDLKNWDTKFMKIDQSTIFDLILAANYLYIESLLNLTCQTVADMITDCKTVNEIRTKLNIKNDYTSEEEEEVRRENQWAFE